jgi:hypothetical protein
MARVAKPPMQETVIRFYYVAYTVWKDNGHRVRYTYVVQAESAQQVMELLDLPLDNFLIGGILIVPITFGMGKPQVDIMEEILV